MGVIEEVLYALNLYHSSNSLASYQYHRLQNGRAQLQSVNNIKLDKRFPLVPYNTTKIKHKDEHTTSSISYIFITSAYDLLNIVGVGILSFGVGLTTYIVVDGLLHALNFLPGKAVSISQKRLKGIDHAQSSCNNYKLDFYQNAAIGKDGTKPPVDTEPRGNIISSNISKGNKNCMIPSTHKDSMAKKISLQHRHENAKDSGKEISQPENRDSRQNVDDHGTSSECEDNDNENMNTTLPQTVIIPPVENLLAKSKVSASSPSFMQIFFPSLFGQSDPIESDIDAIENGYSSSITGTSTHTDSDISQVSQVLEQDNYIRVLGNTIKNLSVAEEAKSENTISESDTLFLPDVIPHENMNITNRVSNTNIDESGIVNRWVVIPISLDSHPNTSDRGWFFKNSNSFKNKNNMHILPSESSRSITMDSHNNSTTNDDNNTSRPNDSSYNKYIKIKMKIRPDLHGSSPNKHNNTNKMCNESEKVLMCDEELPFDKNKRQTSIVSSNNSKNPSLGRNSTEKSEWSNWTYQVPLSVHNNWKASLSWPPGCTFGDQPYFSTFIGPRTERDHLLNNCSYVAEDSRTDDTVPSNSLSSVTPSVDWSFPVSDYNVARPFRENIHNSEAQTVRTDGPPNKHDESINFSNAELQPQKNEQELKADYIPQSHNVNAQRYDNAENQKLSRDSSFIVPAKHVPRYDEPGKHYWTSSESSSSESFSAIEETNKNTSEYENTSWSKEDYPKCKCDHGKVRSKTVSCDCQCIKSGMTDRLQYKQDNNDNDKYNVTTQSTEKDSSMSVQESIIEPQQKQDLFLAPKQNFYSTAAKFAPESFNMQDNFDKNQDTGWLDVLGNKEHFINNNTNRNCSLLMPDNKTKIDSKCESKNQSLTEESACNTSSNSVTTHAAPSPKKMSTFRKDQKSTTNAESSIVSARQLKSLSRNTMSVDNVNKVSKSQISNFDNNTTSDIETVVSETLSEILQVIENESVDGAKLKFKYPSINFKNIFKDKNDKLPRSNNSIRHPADYWDMSEILRQARSSNHNAENLNAHNTRLPPDKQYATNIPNIGKPSSMYLLQRDIVNSLQNIVDTLDDCIAYLPSTSQVSSTNIGSHRTNSDTEHLEYSAKPTSMAYPNPDDTDVESISLSETQKHDVFNHVSVYSGAESNMILGGKSSLNVIAGPESVLNIVLTPQTKLNIITPEKMSKLPLPSTLEQSESRLDGTAAANQPHSFSQGSANTSPTLSVVKAAEEELVEQCNNFLAQINISSITNSLTMKSQIRKQSEFPHQPLDNNINYEGETQHQQQSDTLFDSMLAKKLQLYFRRVLHKSSSMETPAWHGEVAYNAIANSLVIDILEDPTNTEPGSINSECLPRHGGLKQMSISGNRPSMRGHSISQVASSEENFNMCSIDKLPSEDAAHVSHSKISDGRKSYVMTFETGIVGYEEEIADKNGLKYSSASNYERPDDVHTESNENIQPLNPLNPVDLLPRSYANLPEIKKYPSLSSVPNSEDINFRNTTSKQLGATSILQPESGHMSASARSKSIDVSQIGNRPLEHHRSQHFAQGKKDNRQLSDIFLFLNSYYSNYNYFCHTQPEIRNPNLVNDIAEENQDNDNLHNHIIQPQHVHRILSLSELRQAESSDPESPIYEYTMSVNENVPTPSESVTDTNPTIGEHIRLMNIEGNESLGRQHEVYRF